MNKQKNDHLPIELENRVENVIQQIDGLEKSIDRLIENLSKIVIYLKEHGENATAQASN